MYTPLHDLRRMMMQGGTTGQAIARMLLLRQSLAWNGGEYTGSTLNVTTSTGLGVGFKSKGKKAEITIPHLTNNTIH